MATSEFAKITSVMDEASSTPNGFSIENESEDGLYVSEELYWAEYYERGDFSYEWNNGYLEEKPVGDYAQYQLYLWFSALLKDFLHVNPIARMIGLEMGFRMKLPKKVTIRKPDLGVVLNSNIAPLGDRERSYKGIFDLCIESISDSTRKMMEHDTVTKKLEYAAAGVTEYYILDEQGRETAFYRLSSQGVYTPISPQNGVIRSTVLPGFQWRVADLYSLPEPPQLIEDPVYRTFASPYFRAERVRAEEERVRAEKERVRAEEERARAEEANGRAQQLETKLLREQRRAEQYAVQLKALGIEIDEIE
jgi:Uma2 family endonuclease